MDFFEKVVAISMGFLIIMFALIFLGFILAAMFGNPDPYFKLEKNRWVCTEKVKVYSTKTNSTECLTYKRVEGT